MGQTIQGKKANGEIVEILVDDDGKLSVVAAISGDAAGGTTLSVEEQRQPAAEDNDKGVIFVSNSRPYIGVPAGLTVFSLPVNDVDYAAKAAPGNLVWIAATNANAAVRYLQIHNKTTAPVNPNVPLYTFALPPGQNTLVGVNVWGDNGVHLSTGIAIGISTTHGTFSAATPADHFVQGAYA